MHHTSFPAILAGLATVLFSLPASAQPILGEPPRNPTSEEVSRLPRGALIQSVTGGFTVDTTSRERVRSFFNAIYRSSDGVPMNTTADVANCVPGTNSTAFQEAVLRRINWFRALAGIPASISLDATFDTKDQDAAEMMSANTNLVHTGIPTSWLCYTANGAEAADKSNLALGYVGPDAITGYILDFGGGNTFVGHRRWILYPQTQLMGTGDVPGQSGRLPANATWVMDGNFGGVRPATREPYVAWPPAGYIPYQVVYPRWSFAYGNADLSSATVTMKSNGVAVAVAQEAYQTGYGESTLVWVPLGLNANDGNAVFPFGTTDTVYSVTVSNITGGAQSTFSYTVTLFDPATPGADYNPPTISGPGQPVVNAANAYTCTPITNATSYQWRTSQRAAGNFTDGAEGGLVNFTPTITGSYPVITNSPVAAGSASFHLAMPTGDDQFLQLNRLLLPATNTLLTFKSRLGNATTSQVARVQASLDGGANWQDLYFQIGAGTNGPGETSFTLRSLSLSNYAGNPTLVRFTYDYLPFGGYYPQTTVAGVGWYLDDIVVTNTQQLVNLTTNATASTNFNFTPTQGTNYNLEARALIFTEFPLSWGPVKQVTATTNAPPVMVLSRPAITNGQIRIDFTLAGSAATFKLLNADQAGGPWTTNASAALTTNVPGSSYRFTATLSGAPKFYRVQTP